MLRTRLRSKGGGLASFYPSALLELDFTRNYYRLGSYATTNFANIPGASITGGAGFATAVDLNGNVVGPFASNTLPVSNAGVEVWEARTNLLTNSANFAGAGWSTLNASIQTDVGTAPDGTQTADKLVDNATSNRHIVVAYPSLASGQTVSFSVFAKAAERSRIELRMSDLVSAEIVAVFNLSAGSATLLGTSSPWTAGSATITPLAGGWYRCTLTGTKGAGTQVGAQIVLDNGSTSLYVGDGTSGALIWGAQLEAGSFPTPYIPTTTAAATRTAMNVLVTGLASILTPPFTLYAEAVLPAIDGVFRTLATFDDGNNSNRYVLTRDNTNSASIVYNPGGVLVSIAGGQTGARVIREALLLKANSLIASANGVLSSPVSLTPITGLQRLFIGRTEAGSPLNGQIRRVLILPDMSDAQLQAITA